MVATELSGEKCGAPIPGFHHFYMYEASIKYKLKGGRFQIYVQVLAVTKPYS